MNVEAFREFLQGGATAIRIVTLEEAEALEMVLSATGGMGLEPWVWSATQGLRRGLLEGSGAVEGTENAAAALVWLRLNLNEPALVVMLDLADHFGDARVVRAARELAERFWAMSRAPMSPPGTGGGVAASRLVLIDHREDVPPSVGHLTQRYEIEPPTDEELSELVKRTVSRLHRIRPVKAVMNTGEFARVVQTLRGLTRRQAQGLVEACVMDDHQFTEEDLPRLAEAKRKLFQDAGVLEYVDAPASMDRIGGLTRLKEWLRQRERAFSPQAKAFGLTPPRGVLLLGVQGAGKSLAARAIATAWKRPLMRLDPGTLYDKYIGESEGRLRAALRQAEAMAPMILWIDEIEKGFASAASTSNDGGLSRRMFGTLLTWMQEHRSPVFLVATANDIEALPPELLRKGRFDEIFFVDLPGEESRRMILEIHLRSRGQDPKAFDLARLAEACTGYSGAEIEQAVISALHKVMSDREATGQDVMLTTERLEKAIGGSPPLSVTMAEKIEALRSWAQGRCVMAE